MSWHSPDAWVEAQPPQLLDLYPPVMDLAQVPAALRPAASCARSSGEGLWWWRGVGPATKPFLTVGKDPLKQALIGEKLIKINHD